MQEGFQYFNLSKYTLPTRLALNRPLNWISFHAPVHFFGLGSFPDSVEHDLRDILRLARQDRLAKLDKHQTCKPMMVSVVSSNPTGGSFDVNV